MGRWCVSICIINILAEKVFHEENYGNQKGRWANDFRLLLFSVFVFLAREYQEVPPSVQCVHRSPLEVDWRLGIGGPLYLLTLFFCVNGVLVRRFLPFLLLLVAASIYLFVSPQVPKVCSGLCDDFLLT